MDEAKKVAETMTGITPLKKEKLQVSKHPSRQYKYTHQGTNTHTHIITCTHTILCEQYKHTSFAQTLTHTRNLYLPAISLQGKAVSELVGLYSAHLFGTPSEQQKKQLEAKIKSEQSHKVIDCDDEKENKENNENLQPSKKIKRTLTDNLEELIQQKINVEKEEAQVKQQKEALILQIQQIQQQKNERDIKINPVTEKILEKIHTEDEIDALIAALEKQKAMKVALLMSSPSVSQLES